MPFDMRVRHLKTSASTFARGVHSGGNLACPHHLYFPLLNHIPALSNPSINRFMLFNLLDWSIPSTHRVWGSIVSHLELFIFLQSSFLPLCHQTHLYNSKFRGVHVQWSILWATHTWVSSWLKGKGTIERGVPIFYSCPGSHPLPAVIHQLEDPNNVMGLAGGFNFWYIRIYLVFAFT